MRARRVWVKQPLEISSEVLDENDEMIVVSPKVADAIVFAGVNVFEKSSVTVTPGTK